MRAPMVFTVLSLNVLLLAACDKTPPRPEVRDAWTGSGAASAATSASWLPPADSASMAASAAAPVATVPQTGERNNAATGSGPESRSMPMAGQNNDHSAPLASAKPASSP